MSSEDESIYYQASMNAKVSSNGYTYPALTQPYDVRFLVLDRSKGTSPITGTIVPAALLGASAYKALSYRWGVDDHPHPINIDGFSVKIKHNLWLALERLLYMDEDVPLWIDALCINQDNEIEKTEQVKRMDVIYRRASEVYAWLGPEDEYSDGAVQELTSLSQFLLSQASFVGDVDPASFDAVQNLNTFYEALGRPNDDSRYLGLSYIRHLMERPWWRRVWVVQEVILAQRVTMMCGRHEVPFTDVLVVLMFLKRLFSAIPQDIEPLYSDVLISIRRPLHLIKLAEASQQLQVPMFPLGEILDVFDNANNLEASDQRDLCWGLLGLVRPDQRQLITVDYANVRWEDVLWQIETAKKMMTRGEV